MSCVRLFVGIRKAQRKFVLTTRKTGKLESYFPYMKRSGRQRQQYDGKIMKNTKELMHCHYGTNNRAPRWTFTDPCKQEVRPGAREESASPAWLAAPAMNEVRMTLI